MAKIEIADIETQKKAGRGIAAAAKLLLRKIKEGRKKAKNKKGREKLID